MRPKEIQELVRIVENSSVDELEITKWWGRKVRIRKHASANAGSLKVEEVLSTNPQPAAPAAPVAAPVGAAPNAAPDAPKAEESTAASESSNYIEIKAPMVGTFYRSPSPESDVYVKEGDIISKGQVLCIIEAMKLMNEIEAEVSGRIVKILIDNAQPIEYNQPLFLIDPS